MRILTLALAFLTMSAVASCGDNGSGDPVDGGGQIDGGTEPDGGTERESRGYVHVIEGVSDFGAYSRVEARFVEGSEPAWHEEVMREGSCALLEFAPAFCDEFCDGVCVAENRCEPWPTYITAGQVSVTGLAAAVNMSPDEYNHYRGPDTLPTDLFTSGAALLASATGGDLDGFTASATGVATLEADITTSITLVPGEDHTVRWTPAPGDAGARVRVTLNANNRGHGQPYAAIIACDVPDGAGSVTISAALVDAFPETSDWTICAGSDCPPSTIMRYTRGAAAVQGGEVELIAASLVEFGVEHHP